MAFHDLPLFAQAQPTAGHDPGAIAEAGKVDGMQRVHRHAAPEFIEAAAQVIRAAAMARPEISSNDLWDGIEALGVTTHDNRASGPVMTDAARRGWIVATDRWIKSTRPSRHRGDVRVWRSRLFVSASDQRTVLSAQN